MEVVVEVGGWEHACCGGAIERNQLVDFQCFRLEGPEGGRRLMESHHGGLDVPPEERVRGRVTEIQVVQEDGDAPSILRLPSGQELRAAEEADESLLEDPWTGEVIPLGDWFLITVQTSR